MKFMFFAGGSYVGGMEVVIQSLMLHLNAVGHQTLAVVSGWNNGDYPARLRTSGVDFEELKLGRFYRAKPLWNLDGLRHLPAAAMKLRRLARDFAPDAVIYPDLQILLIARAILPRTKTVLYEHNDPRSRGATRLIAAVNRRADRIVCVSRFVAEGAREAGFDRSKVVVVHNGIELAAVPRGPMGDGPMRLGIIGQLLPRKQHLALVQALATLRAESPALAFRLKIIGDSNTAYAGEVRDMIAHHQMEDLVEWVGFVQSRDKLYSLIDVAVSAAVGEPFGTTILEAAAYGLPVIGARSGGTPEMIVDGATGLLFEPSEPRTLVAALTTLLGTPGLAVRLGQQARTHIETSFSMDRMARRFAEVVAAS